MYSNWDYLKIALLLIVIITVLIFGAWAFTAGPCATTIAEMPSWCLFLMNRR